MRDWPIFDKFGEPCLGVFIGDVAKQIWGLARTSGRTQIVLFNDTPLMARPDDESPAVALDRWDEFRRAA